MKQALWAVNSSLIALCILGHIALLFISTPIARKVSLEPTLIDQKISITSPDIDIKKIYGVNDLFDTFVPKPLTMEQPAMTLPPIPEAPPLIPLSIPIEPQKTFIAALPVTLKGVMYNSMHPDQSLAIIQFQNSKDEANYKTGDLIQDAQVLKIYPDRVIILRSNGQRETLYLRENEAKKDLAGQMAKEISTLKIPIKNGIYQVPVDLFKHHVKSLGNFIDLIDITTVYQQGKSIGCRIAKSDKNGLAAKLGLLAEDIIVQVDQIPVSDISSRINVFNHVISLKIGSIISVSIKRNNRLINIEYELIDSLEKKKPMITHDGNNAHSSYTIEEQKEHILKQKVKLAPTAYQIEMEERKKMAQARSNKIDAKVK